MSWFGQGVLVMQSAENFIDAYTQWASFNRMISLLAEQYSTKILNTHVAVVCYKILKFHYINKS